MERLTGKWDVRITSGPFWLRAMNLVGDTKVIDGDKGYNRMLGVKWGEFTIHKGSEFNDHAEFTLRYNNWGEFLGYIIDTVTFSGDDLLKGRFYMKDSDWWKFVGNFEMARVKCR